MSLIVINIIIMTLFFNSCKSGQARLALATCGPVYFLVFLVGLNTHEEIEKIGQFVIRANGSWSVKETLVDIYCTHIRVYREYFIFIQVYFVA